MLIPQELQLSRFTTSLVYAANIGNLFVFSKKISTNLIYYSIDNKIFYTE